VARALLVPGNGTVPLVTVGLIAPKPVASKTTEAPGAVLTTTEFEAVGRITLCAENNPRSDIATPARNGWLVRVPTVTVTFTDGVPTGISNGTCTFSCVGETKRMGAAMPPILTVVPEKV
jgi:hypothetical protein